MHKTVGGAKLAAMQKQALISLNLRRHAHRTLAKHLMHMAHLSGNTSGVSKLSSDLLNYTGYRPKKKKKKKKKRIIQDIRETCVSRSLTFRLETKMPWRQTPSLKKKAVVFTTVMTSAYQDQPNAGFSKVCEIFKSLQRRIFKIRSRFLHTGLLLWRHFHAPKRDTERNELWLVVWHVAQTASWAGLGQWKLPYIPDLQPSVWRSGYARLGVDDLLRRQCLSTLYLISEHMEETMV